MRRRKWRRLVNRYSLKSMFKSVRVKLDYRDPTLGGDRDDKWEGRVLLIVIAVVAIFFYIFSQHGLK